MSIGIKLPLYGAWKERFQNVAKLNDYAKKQPVEISNATISNYSIDGAVLNGGRFENTHWKDVSAKQTNLTKTVFSKGILENVDFSDSVLTDVVFEDMMLWEVRFFGPTLNNVRFVRCTFNGSNVDRTKNSRIEVTDSAVVNTSFSDGQLVAVFRGSKLKEGNEITDLIPPSSLTFEKSELNEVDMDRTKLKELIIENTKFDSIFDVGSADSIVIRNSVIDTSFSATTIGHLVVDNTQVARMISNKAKINSLSLTNCNRVERLVMYEASVATFNVTNCPLYDFRVRQANIGSLHIKDGSITTGRFEGMKAKTVLFENVTLDGELDFTGVQIGDLKTQNVTKQPGLKLITTGSNVKF